MTGRERTYGTGCDRGGPACDGRLRRGPAYDVGSSRP